MLSKMLTPKKARKLNYEVLFLGNGKEQAVEVQEVNQVDFSTVKERLERGESVFITSKRSQKLVPPRQKVKVQNAKTRFVTSLSFDHL